MTVPAVLAAAIFAAALLYSSVGHGGASAYLALMALAGIEPAVMRPAALALNILVAGIGAFRYIRAGFFSWRAFAPFAATSVPLAFVGGTLALPGVFYRWVVGAVLLTGALRLFLPDRERSGPIHRRPQLWLAALLGAGIGLLAGLTGVGGGIFLSPLLVLTGWATVREQAGVAAAFILINSAAGLAGVVGRTGSLPPPVYLWAGAAVAGGLVGTELGSRRLGPTALRRLLALVLIIAGLKLLLP
ncbi:MAG: sulfite exporter TauE/SafE family protein [Armatimonadota bacterium]|nr:sulfite exporter TauE/SafE family protein [Armatimonadota bacterium]MDR7427172.1 sulfite exporter TauE/SafE family protein [Armatimonadota bacterium]MDR7473545.1 sulfite exporter TauE/SafE family protein [Armatimonadota bacterium]MDR7539976.1 sulfite exporter TauE/SafE family protein [Armatimonadota bacterium]